MDASHDGSHSGSPSPPPPPPPATRAWGKTMVRRPFAWKHDQDPLDAARLGDLNLAVRSHHHTASAAPHDIGRKPAPPPPPHRAFGISVATAPADKPGEHRQRILVAFKKGRQSAGKPDMVMMKTETDAAAAYAAMSRAGPDGAVRRSPPAAAAELADDRKPRRRIYPVPRAGDQGVGSSSAGCAPSPWKKPAPSSHRRKAAEALEDIDDSEAMYQLGLEVALKMSPTELKAAVDKFLGLDDLPKSERVAAMQKRDAERPPFDFRLDKEQAKADVKAILNHKKCRKE
ncbi:hypothetical protein ACP4OV_001363 [Aristida adscensionis]